MAIKLNIDDHSAIPLSVSGVDSVEMKHSEAFINAISPSARVNQTKDGAVITITDKNGTTTAAISNGQPGPAGSDAEVTAENIEEALGYVPMEGMTILSYGHSTWAEFEEAYEANRIVYCKASSSANPATGTQSRMAFLAYYASGQAEFQYYRSNPTHTDAQQGDQVFCYTLRPAKGGTWSVETRQASSRVVAGTGLASAYTTDKLTLSLDADYKTKIDTLWTSSSTHAELEQLYNAFPVDSVSGAVASFVDGADNLPLKSLTVGIDPVQDLHGYSSPWPAGGKGNILPTDTFESARGITVTRNADGSVTFSGTATSPGRFFMWSGNLVLTEDHVFSVGVTRQSTSFSFNIGTSGNNNTVNIPVGRSSVTAPAGTYVSWSVYIRANIPIDMTLYPMLKLSTDTDTTFFPYSNICPIGGWTGANITTCGKNILMNTAHPHTINSVAYNTNADGSITANGTATNGNGRCDVININNPSKALLDMFSGKKLAGCPEGGANNTYLVQFIINNTVICRDYGNGVRIPDLSQYYGASNLYVDASVRTNYTAKNLVFKPIISEDATYDTYEPYSGESLAVSWAAEAGTVYNGSLNVLTGVLTVNSVAASFEFATPTTKDKKNRWAHGKSLPAGYLQEMLGKMWTVNDLYPFYVSNLPIVKEGDAEEGQSTCAFYGHNDFVEFQVRVDAGRYTAEEAVQIANAATVVYPTEPVTCQLTPQEVKSLLGQNNIRADTGDTSVEYRADIKAYINRKIAEAIAALS